MKITANENDITNTLQMFW